ncbi:MULTISPECIES: hypothetical protein [Streptacidiphilus]|uniref:XRE family transcriptional regulator n=1 Tax=Streptacidiphilus cavernicola TaxID=3342716 RepID=A0ABV6UNZ2_9ACTN|nr:hypothetical protein [Streptacidiphilus jeojiense]
MARSNLARLRRAVGHTQESFLTDFAQWAHRIGANAGASVRQLRRWEGEDPPPLPHPGQQAVLEAIFGIPLAEMGFTVPEHRRHPVARLRHDGSVRRREFIADVGGLAAAAALPTSGSRVGMDQVRGLRGRVDGLYRLDHASGGLTARQQAHELLEQIGGRLTGGPCTERVAVQLHAMLGEIHCHLGWLCHDAGRVAEARSSALEAMAAARMTGDAQLEMRALSTLSLLAVDRHQPWEATSAVGAAQDLASRHAGPGVKLVLSLREARAALAAGDLTGSRRALSGSIALHDRAAEETDAPRWVRFAGPVEIDYATGTHYLQAGVPKAAVPFLRAAVEGLAAGYARNTALYRARLASVLLQAGEVEEACAQMATVVAGADALTSARLASRLVDFRQAAAGIDTATARDTVALLESTAEAG